MLNADKYKKEILEILEEEKITEIAYEKFLFLMTQKEDVQIDLNSWHKEPEYRSFVLLKWLMQENSESKANLLNAFEKNFLAGKLENLNVKYVQKLELHRNGMAYFVLRVVVNDYELGGTSSFAIELGDDSILFMKLEKNEKYTLEELGIG